ncbi:flagellar protein FliT [Vibrio sp. CAU 1672]|uniref:flagellar protein FliT n=1 Tax=Vibrio sp. CAU 1672 TaxID=3032594 RepID=UPI0023DAD4CF|nr:flagellar protein FliT [Vibrio sp. CAU 1672]MDF2153725.1 flagellar protein FliT [Vibrio sp. CAU 1672]
MFTLNDLRDVDQQISLQLEKVDLNTEEILRLVDIREQILQNLLPTIEQNSQARQDPEWQTVVARTQEIVELMQSETLRVGRELQKFRHGQRSLQQYKKFI